MAKKPSKLRESITAAYFVAELRDWILEQKSRYAFFLGAGCSVSSRIPGATKLTRDWLDKIHKRDRLQPLDFDTWVKKRFPKYDETDPAAFYADALRAAFPAKQQQQKEIERLVDAADDPGFAYATFAQLITRPDCGHLCNLVLTTNFDDLVADALYLYTNLKPRVISHEALAGFATTGYSERPLVVKLHGDALFDPKNLDEEVEKLANNFSEVLADQLRGNGLIFLGYGGHDIGAGTAGDTLRGREG